MSWFSKLIGGGIVEAVENVALEAIQTDMEKAEANAVYIKALDPNGAMRRQLSAFVCKAYGFYLLVSFALIIMHFFGIGDPQNSQDAMEAIKLTFAPITTAFGIIVSASFGVNGVNSYKGN